MVRFVAMLCCLLAVSQAAAQAASDLQTQADTALQSARYEDALALQQQRVAILNAAGDRLQEAEALRDLAETHRILGAHGQAEDALRAALALFEDHLGPDSSAVAVTLNMLGFVIFEAGDATLAEQVLRRAMEVHAAADGTETLAYADTVSNYGTVLDWLDRSSEAETYHRLSVALSTRLAGPVSQSTSRSLNNLALSLEYQGRTDEAEAVYREALALDRELFGNRHEDTAIALTNLADLVAGKARFGATFEAIGLYKEAIDIRVDVLGDDHPDTARARADLGQIYLRLNDFDTARALFDRAIAAYTLPENREDAYQYNSVFSVSAALHLHTRPDDPATAFETVQWPMSSAAGIAMSATTERLAAGDDALAGMLRQRQGLTEQATQLRSDILAASAAGAGDTARQLREQLGSVRAASDQLAETLRRDFPEYASIDPARPYAASEVAGLLHPGEALVLLTGGQTRSSGDAVNGSIFVVRADGQVAGSLLEAGWSLWFDSTRLVCGLSLVPGPGCELAAQVTGAPAFRGTFSMTEDGAQGFGPPPFDLDLAHDLYQRTLGRVAGALDGVDHLIVVAAEDEFAPLPFALMVQEPPVTGSETDRLRAARWLIRDHAITALPSVSALAAIRSATAPQLDTAARFLGVGDPVIGQAAAVDCAAEMAPLLAQLNADQAGLSRYRLAGGDTGTLFAPTATGAMLAQPEQVRALARLPDTRCELERIRDSLGQGDLLLDVQATETVLKAMNDSGALAGYDILSFATHGLVAGEAGATEPALVLTPPDVPSVLDDGLLTATEIAGLRLNADWVLLSACNTAAGTGSGGESLSGLARSFFFAGARSILVSHWPVHSEAAVRLTTGAFAHIADTPEIGRAEALRRSVLSILDDPNATAEHLHPRYWAPFSLVGEGG